IAALNYSIDLAKKNKDIKPIFYVLACRIGPFIGDIKKKIKKLNGKLFVNPDGHEWLRAKWSYPIKKYWKYSEKLMVKYADLLVCDSKNIENYIHLNYKKYDPQTVYIAYGADLTEPTLTPEDSIVNKWYRTNGIERGNYYLIVGRFVPENNYEAMIKGFMQSSTMKDLVIITDVEQNKFYQQLKKETKFDEDIRIKFVGTVYDQELLKYIRKNAFAYIHGHEVGGTNPSLLEALYFTRINLLLNVGFNREVGDNAAYYWNKKYLAQTIDVTEQVTESTYDELDRLSSKIIIQHYTWEKVVQVYQKIFLLWS
ncbi:MAG: DUF1972 domain-containing protein, partial [Tetragenococcus koreensis]|nr:DUF1972 domain-containing protein [Tetragenococcus koreensis]